MSFDPSTAVPADEFDPTTAVPEGTPPTRAVLQQVVKTKPDTAAEVERLAKRYPAPYEVIERNVDDFQAFDMAEGIAERLSSAPLLEGAIRRDARLGKLTHDDIEPLAKIESSFAKIAAASTGQAVLGISEGIWRTPDAASRAVGYLAGTVEKTGLPRYLNPIRGVQDVIRFISEGRVPAVGSMGGTNTIADQVNAGQKLLGADTETFGTPFKDVQTLGQNADKALQTTIQTGNLQQIGQIITDPNYWSAFLSQAVPSLYMAMKSGGSVAFMGWMEGMEQAGNAAEFEQKTGQKISDAEFTQAVAQTAIVNALLEKFGLDKVLGAKGQGLKGIFKAMFGEGGTEGLQQLNSNVAAAIAYDGGKSLSEGVLASIMGGAGAGGSMSLVQVAAAQVHQLTDKRAQQADAAQQHADNLAEQLKLAGGALLRERSPEQFRALMGEMADGASVYVDGGVLNQLPAEVIATLPQAAQDQIADAAATGGTVEIPVADILTIAPGTPLEQVIVEHARMDPTAMSQAEATAAGQQAQVYLQQEAERVIQQATDQEAMRASAEVVRTTILSEINATGRYRPAVAEGMSQWASAFYTTMASRLGLTPEQFYAQHRLRILGAPSGQGGQVMDQPKLGELEVEGYHFSNAERPTIVTGAFGTGLAGSSKDEYLNAADKRLAKRAYFYADKGTGINPESGVGGIAQRASLRNVYDGDTDPMRLKAGRNKLQFESAVLDAGFSGYLTRMEGTQSGQVIMLGDQAISAEVLGPMSKTTGKRVPAQGQRASLGRDVIVDALNANAALPSGSPTLARWQELLARTPEVLDALREAGVFDGNQNENVYKSDLVKRFTAATDAPVYNQSLSSRLPSAVKATEDPLTDVLAISYDVVLSDPKTLAKNVAALQALPNTRKLTGKGAKDPVRNAEAFIDHVVDNLLWLHDHMPAPMRERARLWYDGGRKTVEAWAQRYGISEMQGAAAIAVLSPQNGWFANVSQAERIADMVFGLREFAWTDEMTTEAERISSEGGLDERMQAAVGKTLGELLATPDIAARWARVYDQTYNNRAYRVLTPEGGAADYVKTGAGNDATMTWKSYATIGKAISVLMDGRAENIHYQLGNEHKVRNFYNNIFDPNSPLGYATIDTHAVAAALLRPLASADIEVAQAFGGGGSSSSNLTGLNGTYPIYLEAYRRAAVARGLQPRQMQSITWEAVRGLFEATAKRGMKAPANAIWERYKKGEIDQKQAQQEILALVGDITPPAWTEVPFDDAVTRTYEGPPQLAIDKRPAAEPKSQIMFEVAPDPNDVALTAEWNALSPAERLAISQRVAAQVVPGVLKELGTGGDFVMQLGGYMGATNPSMTLRLERPELALTAAKMLGHALSQDSMMVVAETPFVGSQPVGVVTITLPEGYGETEVAALYDRLWELKQGDDHLVGGHTTSDGQMVILNYSGLEDADLAARINAHLGGEFTIDIDTVFSAFPEKKDYGYASERPEGATAPSQSPAQRRPGDLRDAAAAGLRADLDARRAAQPADAGGAPAQSVGPLERWFGEESTMRNPANPSILEQAAGGFDRFVGDATRVDLGDAHEFKAGEPVVVAALHGTTGDFTTFDTAMANIESDLGGGFYFTNNPADVGENYAGMGPDLTNKIQGEAERLESNDDLDPDEAKRIARDKWMANEGLTMPVWVKMQNPVVLGGSSETFLSYEESYDEETDEYGEPTGDLIKIIEALREVASDERYGDADIEQTIGELMERAMGNGGLSARELIATAKLSEGLVYATDYESDGKLAPQEILRRAFEAAGFDGFIDQAVDEKFGSQSEGQRKYGKGMKGMDADTVHFIAFTPTQIKSRLGNNGEFDESNPDILKQGPRGTFNPKSLELVLNPNANLSTFFHETGHFFLEVLADIASQPNAPAQIVEDMGTFLKWAGITGDEDVGGADSGAPLAQRVTRADKLATWFGTDNTMVNHDGTPRVLYHGTTKAGARGVKAGQFRRSKIGAMGPAVYLGDDAEASAGYDQGAMLKVYARGKYLSNRQWTEYVNRHGWSGAEAAATADGWAGVYDTRFENAVAVWNPENIKSVDAKQFADDGTLLGQDGQPTPNAPPVQRKRTALETWNAMTLDQKRKYHERWAESIEQYVMEGKAPSVELQPLMRRFATWLKSVYGSIKQFLASRGQVVGGGDALNQMPAPDGVLTDDSGKPLVLYHGTAADIQKFDPNRAGRNYFSRGARKGIFFTNNPGTASVYAEQPAGAFLDPAQPDRAHFGRGTANIVPAYLAMKNPLVIKTKKSPDKFFDANQDSIYARVEKGGHDGVIVRGGAEFKRDTYVVFDPKQIVSAISGEVLGQEPNAPAGPPMALNDDIRRVMDRLLATDEQIAQANEVAGLVPDVDADATAAERLNKRSMADLKWAVKARDQVIGKLRKQAAAIEKAIREAVTVEVDMTPEMRAKRALDALTVSPEYAGMLAEHKALRKAAETTMRDEVKAALLASNPDAKGLVKGQLLMKNKRDIDNKVDAAMIKWDEANPTPKRPVNVTDEDVATIADSFGFESVDAMMQAIDAYGPRAAAIDGLTEQRMLEEHGDLIDERAISEAANEAVHNAARARSLATELRSQGEMLNTRTDTGQTNAKGSKITVNALVEAAKQFGANVVARTPLRDLKAKAWQHTAAERRAGKAWQAATAAGKTEEAVKAKQDQVLNHAAARAAIDAQAEARKILDFFKRVTKGNDEKVVEKGYDADIVNAARATLAAYGVETSASKGAQDYLDLLAKNDPETYNVVKPMVDGATQNAQPLDALTFEELQALHEEIQAMWHLAKRSRQMEVDGDLLDVEDVADEVYARLEEIGIPDTVPGETGALTAGEERARRWLQQAPALLRRVEQWAEAKDGKFGGPFLRYIFQPVKAAADRYRTDRLEYRKKFQALVDSIAPMMRNEVIAAPELGYVFGRGHNGIGMAELLHAVLHTGNESNKRKLLLGRGWATGNDGVLDTSRWDAFVQRMINEGKLTKAHYDFAQGVWDLLEETKPLAQKTHRDVFGRYFAEVTADAFVTPFGTYRGGYVPAQADPLLVQDADLRELLETENAGMAQAFPATNRGFTKGRVEYNRPLKLDLRTLPQHIDKVLLFSHMEPAVRGVAKLLRQKKVSQPLARVDPAAMGGMLKPWLNRSARQTVETPMAGDAGMNRLASTIRGRVGMALMFANVSNTLQQITGALTASIRVKPALMMRATAQFIRHPKKLRDSVWALSPYMADRASNEVAVLSDTMEAILIDPSVYQRSEHWTRRHGYFLQTAFDNVMSPIIWSAAYNQGVAEGMDERMAIRFADGTIRQTQGSTLAEDVSRIETGPAYARLFTQFIGYFNMMANTNATALQQIAAEQGLKKGAGKAFGVLLLGLLAPIWVAEAIAHVMRGGPDDEDDDGYLDDWLAAVFGFGTIKGMLSGVPFIGAIGQSVVNRFNDQPADDKMSLSPTVSVLESAAGAPASVYKAIVADGKAQKAVRDVAALITVTTGLPAMTLARPAGYLAGVAQGKIDPTGPVDAVRGTITGTASPDSKQ